MHHTRCRHHWQSCNLNLKSYCNLKILTTDQVSQIRVIYQSVQRLSKLNKTLLLLSKIENRQFKDLELIKVNQVIEKHLRNF